MDAKEIQAVLTYLLDSRAIRPRFYEGIRLASGLIGAALTATAEDTEDTEDIEEEATEKEEEEEDAEEEDAEEEDAEEEDTEDTEEEATEEEDAEEEDTEDTEEEATEEEDAEEEEEKTDDAPETADKFRRGWNNRILTGEPEGKNYLFRRASDGSWYCLRGRHVVWSDDRNAAEVRRGMRAAGVTAIGISTHAGSTIEVVDAESGVVVRRYADRRRVD